MRGGKYSGIPDEILVKEILTGDELAFEELVRRYRERLFSFALRRLDDHEAAQDATQEALIRIHLGLPGFRGESTVSTWLHGVMNFVCLAKVRSEKRLKRSSLSFVGGSEDLDLFRSDQEEELEDLVERFESREELRDARSQISDLPKKYQGPLLMHVVDQLPLRAIEETTGISQGTVKTQIYRGRQRLRRASHST